MPRLPHLLALLLLTACASGGSAAAPTAAVAFAPALEVDTAAMRRLPSGLLVRDLDGGTGSAAARGREVTVHYTGWLPDGTRFDTSAGGQPVTFRLGAGTAIRGWEEGLVGLRPGGRRQLVVPPRLAYGRRGLAGKVPPDATLVFLIEMVGVR